MIDVSEIRRRLRAVFDRARVIACNELVKMDAIGLRFLARCEEDPWRRRSSRSRRASSLNRRGFRRAFEPFCSESMGRIDHDLPVASVPTSARSRARIVGHDSRRRFSTGRWLTRARPRSINHGLAWWPVPLFFAAAGLSVAQNGVLAFFQPAVWGVLQLWTGHFRPLGAQLIASGTLLQGVALGAIALARGFLVLGRRGSAAGRRHRPWCSPPSATWRTRLVDRLWSRG
jgi:hypothetical protein